MGLNAMTMEAHLESAAEHTPERSCHDGDRRVLDSHAHSLSGAYQVFDARPVLGGHLVDHQLQIGAAREVRALVADHQGIVGIAGLPDGLFDEELHSLTDCVGFGAELYAGHAVTQIYQAGVLVLVEGLAVIFQVRQHYGAFARRQQARVLWPGPQACSPSLPFL